MAVLPKVEACELYVEMNRPLEDLVVAVSIFSVFALALLVYSFWRREVGTRLQAVVSDRYTGMASR